MPLDCCVTISDLAPGATYTVDPQLDLSPNCIVPDRNTSIVVVSVAANSVVFRNDGLSNASANFCVRREHSVQTAALPSRLWAGTQPRVLCTTHAPMILANSDVETSQFSAARWGSLTLPANFLCDGRTLRFRTNGYITAGSADTFLGNAYLLGVDFHIEKDTLGSYSEYVKYT